MKLVPHIFVDQINAEEYSSYSYSLNHNSKVITILLLKDLYNIELNESFFANDLNDL
jgi:hypothetical protein